VVTASEDHTAQIWNSVTGEEYLTLKGHKRGVRTAFFSPDGKRVVTASTDGTVKIWPVDPLSVAKKMKPREMTFEEKQKYTIRIPVE